jgi:aspartate/methionine/tyrosine aminotransferase
VSEQGRVRSSAYMEWAKLHSKATFNLAASGVLDYPLAGLPVAITDLEIGGQGSYGWPPLLEALARKCGVAVECVVHANGTSLANHLAMAALIEPGDEVLIEEPAYDPIPAAARFLGARVTRFPRRPENAWRVDPREVERALTPRTRVIVISNLHNPSGARTDEATLARIGEIARAAGARVLVDEVYLECVFEEPWRSCVRLGPQFLATSSLTKAYGLSGLRCGFILAEPDLARRIWRLNDLYGVIPPHPAELLSVIALQHLDRIAERARGLLATNRAALGGFLASRSDLEGLFPDHGTLAFPRLRSGNVERLHDLLREKYDTSIVPGRFFERPDHLRIAVGGPSGMVAEGMRRLGAALDELAAG